MNEAGSGKGVGKGLGSCVGRIVGAKLGFRVGCELGCIVGLKLGSQVGCELGDIVNYLSNHRSCCLPSCCAEGTPQQLSFSWNFGLAPKRATLFARYKTLGDPASKLWSALKKGFEFE